MRLAELLVTLPYRRFCGREIDGHRIGGIVGAGGSAVTFEAVGPDGRPEAAKLLRPVREEHDLVDVWREVYALERASHQTVPEWRGILRDGRAYFVMLSRMPGEALDRWLFERRHAFGPDELARVGLQVADALAHLHTRGVAHGDVRPANVLYDGERVSLVDFGSSVLDDPAACALDIAGFADLVIYLRYSTYAGPQSRSGASGWRDELDLSPEQRRLLDEALVHPERLCMADVRDRFAESFGASSRHFVG